MTVVRTSIGQACSNALAKWLASQLPASILVQARWPEASVVAPGAASGKTAVVTVHRQGKRTGHDLLGRGTMASSQPIPNTIPQQYYLLIEFGQITQPLQLDVWCATDVDRDQTIDFLDDALNVGWEETLGPVGTSGVGWSVTASDDPVRDGLLLPLDPNDGYAGLATVLLESPEIQDDAESVAASNYRAFYSGNATGVFSRVTTGYLITQPKFSPTTQGG
jgi:hypothetical protein